MDRGEPLIGTAPVATRFLMIEHAGPWPAEPLEVFAPATAAALAQAVAAVAGQVFLVRRPHRGPAAARRTTTVPQRWFAVDTAGRREMVGSWTTEDDLAAAARALSDGLDRATDPARPALLVCCHARRDQCCAIAGRPLAADLAASWPDDTWECTHLGGHRFAPTFLMLPDGVCYGRVPHGTGPTVVTEHRAGRPAVDLLRGECAYAGWEQAALAHLRLTAPDAVTSRSAGPDAWTVVVAVGARTLTVDVHAVRQPPLPLSCGDARAKPAVSYVAEPQAAHRGGDSRVEG